MEEGGGQTKGKNYLGANKGAVQTTTSTISSKCTEEINSLKTYEWDIVGENKESSYDDIELEMHIIWYQFTDSTPMVRI